MNAGILEIPDRNGEPIKCLAWDDGKKAKVEGHDLASVCRDLTMADLDFWLEKLSWMDLERRVIQAEIDRRDPRGMRDTLFESVEENKWQ
jgi:hypothetical protein